MPQVPVVQNHPAETGAGLAAAVAVLIANLFHIRDPAEVSAMVVVIGAIPGVITWAVLTARKRKGAPPTNGAPH